MEEKIKKRVLILSPFFRPNVGGAETHLNDLTEYLRKHGFYTYVLTYQPLTTKAKGLAFEKKDNLEIRRISWFGHNFFHKLEPYPILEFLYLFPRLFTAAFCFMLKNHKKIDVVHAHGFIAAIITRVITIFFPKRAVMSIHAIYNFRERKTMAKFAYWVLFSFAAIFALAKESKNDLVSAGIDPQKIKICPQWVNQKLFIPRNKIDCQRELNLKGNFFALFVGRLIEKKGAEILATVAKDLPQINFIFVGDGPLYNELEQAEKKQRNLYVVGSKTQEEIVMFYGASDIVIIPSLYEEGFARVVLEALSCGRPVIVSNSGCLPEMITDSVGILIEPTKENIHKVLYDLYKDKKKLEKLTQNTRVYAKKHFSEQNAEQVTRTYL